MRTLHDRHLGWDRTLPSVAEVSPGAEVELTTIDCFDGQLDEAATADDVARLDLARANPLTGPVHVLGARPGDALVVDVLGVTVAPIGWTTLLPGFGLLAQDFPDPHVVVSGISGDRVQFGRVATLRARPFLGTVGLAPAAPGPHGVIPPRRVGGNLDCRDVRPGARLLLPVEVDGGLLSVGDAHAAQGDGEVCGTAVEVAATVRLRVGLLPGSAPPTPRVELPARPATATGPRTVTTGVGPDLEEGSRQAVRAMIDQLVDRYDLAPADAYAVCSVAGHLRIVEVVNAPSWTVALDLDVSVLDG
jgi:acetamidase/formamidase